MLPWGDTTETPFDLTSNINCPMMFHFGATDGNPSPDDRVKLDAELTRLGKPHQFFSYPEADHGFADHTGARYNREGAEIAWPRTLQFFAAHLKGAPVV
jgi:carboxymethylenebutenolidase